MQLIYYSLHLLQATVIQIDSHYYGGVVIAPLNIVLYNVFSDHGPDIYGNSSVFFLTITLFADYVQITLDTFI